MKRTTIFLLTILLFTAQTITAQTVSAESNKGPLFKTNTGPVITIVEPALSRGLSVKQETKKITVKGTAVDEDGVQKVLVNNTPAVVDPNGIFLTEITLTVGSNEIKVEAFDMLDNSEEVVFTIDYSPTKYFVDEKITRGKYYALVIGIDSYNGTWPPLQNAVNDAEAVADLLKDEYQFDEVMTILDEEATRKNIIGGFEYMMRSVTENDNLLVFYSGHGDFKEQLNKGYWVPVDAKSLSTADYISNSDIQTYINGIRSKHTLLVSDACFSGDIFRGRVETIPFENDERYFKEIYRRPSRSALTSGGIEPVTDGGRDGHSVFTYYFLKALKSNNSRYFSAGQLYNELRIPVTNNSEQTPIFQPIKNTGDEGGEFLFMKLD